MKYPKINSVFLRDAKGRLILGEYSRPEFGYLQNNTWLWTEKIDGTNTRLIFMRNETGYEYRVAGRTDQATFHPEVAKYLYDVAQTIATQLPQFWTCPEVIFFGETCGFKVQADVGKMYCPDGHRFLLFDVWAEGRWMEWSAVVDLAEKLRLERVPLVVSGTIPEAIALVKQGFLSLVAQAPMTAEGVVGKPAVPLFDSSGDRIITKLKHKDFAQARGTT